MYDEIKHLYYEISAYLLLNIIVMFVLTVLYVLLHRLVLSYRHNKYMEAIKHLDWNMAESKIMAIDVKEVCKPNGTGGLIPGPRETQYTIISKYESDIFYSKPLKHNPESLLSDTIPVFINPDNHNDYYVETGELE